MEKQQNPVSGNRYRITTENREIKTIPVSILKRGMVLADDVKTGKRILADSGSLLSGLMIATFRKMGVSKVKIYSDPKPENPLPPLESPDISNQIEKVTHAVMLYDEETDDLMKIRRLIKSLTLSRDPAIIEACDFVLNYYEDMRSRALAIEALDGINDVQAVGTILTALRDDSQSVRLIAQKAIGPYLNESGIRELLQVIDSCLDEEIKVELYEIFKKYRKAVTPLVEKLADEMEVTDRLKVHLLLIQDQIIKDK
ncbi:MAG: hypothetical protein PHW04_03035 [Candidatus Wallbacteria bacterium]|nr:hypothetical protein [Candidatus Wallbacteria bacterium]